MLRADGYGARNEYQGEIFGGRTSSDDRSGARSPEAPKATRSTVSWSGARKRHERQSQRRPPPPSRRECAIGHDGVTHVVQLINLSGGGAMVSGDLDPEAVGQGRASPRRERDHRMRGPLGPRRPLRPGIRARNADRLRRHRTGGSASGSHSAKLPRSRIRSRRRAPAGAFRPGGCGSSGVIRWCGRGYSIMITRARRFGSEIFPRRAR